MLKHVYASQMPLVDLANKVKEGRNHETSSNFNSNSVLVSFLPGDEHSRGMHLDPGLLKLYNTNAITKSVLLESDKHLQSIKKLDESICNVLDTNTFIAPDNGGHMFFTVFTEHIMENESTLYTMYHLDFNEPVSVPPWLCTYLIAQTLNHNAITSDQVQARPLQLLTEFIT